MKNTYKTIAAYSKGQKGGDKAICELLQKEIERAMPKKATSKIWHGSPVWFIDENPIVGYHKLKDRVRILFWSGQTFGEKDLAKEGTFKAAEATFKSVSDIKVTDLRRWLKKSKEIQWDYKNIVKQKGVLKRIK